jgi:formaldehyde-activating enzyme
MSDQHDLDGRISQGWGGVKSNGVHVNVFLARRGSPTAAALTSLFTNPSPGFCPILVVTGEDQHSYQTVLPPTMMLNKIAPSTEFQETLIFGAAQVGIAQAVLDGVAAGLLEANQDTLVFVAVWIDGAADSEDAVRRSMREAMNTAIKEAGRPAGAADALVAARDSVTHPFYNG